MPKVRLGATRSRRKPPPEGWELIEPTLEELEGKMREAETESHEGKRKVIHRDSCTFTRGILDLNRPEGLSGCSWDADRTNPISRENIAQDDHSDDDGIGCSLQGGTVSKSAPAAVSSSLPDPWHAAGPGLDPCNAD